MTHELPQLLRSFVSLLSSERASNEEDTASNRKIAEYLQNKCPVSKGGLTIEITSMCASPVTLSPKKSYDCNEMSKPLSASILKQLIQKGNPFPPKTSKAKGKKKLQKRRRNSKVNIPPSLKSTLNPCAFDVDNEEMLKNMNSTLYFKSKKDKEKDDVVPTIDTSDSIIHAPHRLNENVKNTVKKILDDHLVNYSSNLIYKSIKANKGEISHDAAKLLAHYGTIDSVATEEDDEQKVMEALELEEKNAKKALVKGTAEVKKSEKNGNGEKKIDQKMSSKSFCVPTNNQEDNSTPKAIKGEEINEEAKSKGTIVKKQTNEPQTKQEKSKIKEVDHVAKIKSIHENSPSLRSMLGMENNTDDDTVKSKVMNTAASKNHFGNMAKCTKVRIEKCSTSFKLADSITSWSNTSTNKDLSIPIEFEAITTLLILNYKANLKFGSSGTISGIVDESQETIKQLKISINVESLLESIVNEIRAAIRSTIFHNTSCANGLNKRIKLCVLPFKNIKEPQQQTVSKDSNVHPNIFIGNSESVNSTSRKRNREETNIEVGNSPERRRLEKKDVKSNGTAIESALRNYSVSRRTTLRTTSRNIASMNGNTSIPSSNEVIHSEMNNQLKRRADSIGDAIEAVRIAERRKSVNQALAFAAAENAKMQEIQELQAAVNTLRRRSSAGNTIGVNSMAAAAEAVRLAERENQLDSLGTRSFAERRNSNSLPFDVINALKESPSPSTADLLRLLEINRRNSANSIGLAPDNSQMNRGRLSFTTASETLQKMELEAAMNTLRRRGNSVGSLQTVDIANMLDQHRDEGHLATMRRRSSYSKDSNSALMDNVLNALRRRSSAGNSMAAAAEAVRLAEMDAAMSSLRQRQNSAGNSSMATAAEVVRLAEMGAARRRSSNATANSMAAAAEIVRMSEAENRNIPSQYNRSFGRRSFTAHNDMTDDHSFSTMMTRSNAANNSMASAAAEAARLADLEANGASFLGNNLLQNQVLESQQRGGSRRRVSFRLDDSLRNLNGLNGLNGMNGFNGMNGYQP